MQQLQFVERQSNICNYEWIFIITFINLYKLFEVILDLQHDAECKIKMTTKKISELKKICIHFNVTKNDRNTRSNSNKKVAG